jgi:hypothetical protein
VLPKNTHFDRTRHLLPLSTKAFIWVPLVTLYTSLFTNDLAWFSPNELAQSLERERRTY